MSEDQLMWLPDCFMSANDITINKKLQVVSVSANPCTPFDFYLQLQGPSHQKQ